MRPGSETNRNQLRKLGIGVVHGDIRQASDIENLPACDWVIDAAANPSVLAGVQGAFSSRQLFEHNLASLVNVLEFSKRHGAGFVLLSSSRVYSLEALTSIPLRADVDRFVLDCAKPVPSGLSAEGIAREFSTAAPVSLYGSLKLAAETIALEYGEAFGFPVWIDRCGVLAGAGQFGTPDQGIFSYWINAHLRHRPLTYIGFDGAGKQVRDAFHPIDLAALIDAQIECGRRGGPRIYTAGGGLRNSCSLAQLTAWCDTRFGKHTPASDPNPRRYDAPWVVMDSREAEREFDWHVEIKLDQLLDQIATHASQHPEWLEVSGL
jgi:CDP-paratose 2-epimerase